VAGEQEAGDQLLLPDPGVPEPVGQLGDLRRAGVAVPAQPPPGGAAQVADAGAEERPGGP